MSNYEYWLLVKFVVLCVAAFIYGFIRRSRQIKQGKCEAED